MSPEAERNLERLVRIQSEQYRYQTAKTSFASDLVFKVLPFVGLFAFLTLVVDSCQRSAR